MDHERQLLADLAGQAPAEGLEEDAEIAEGIQPFVTVPGERPLHAPAVDVEAAQVEGLGGGEEDQRRLPRLSAAAGARPHPLQKPRVFPVSRPPHTAPPLPPPPHSPADPP